MPRLIDADVHECWACVHNNCGCDTWCEYGEAFELREDVKNAPTIEAVPVVHCKDCEYWGIGHAWETDRVKCCRWARYMVGENGYCVYGKKV